MNCRTKDVLAEYSAFLAWELLELSSGRLVAGTLK